MKFLCALEAVNLENYFGDCEDLNTTRGGGLAVLEIASQVAERLGATPITSGASQGLLRIDGENPSQVEALVRRELDKEKVLTHTTIMVSVCEEDPFSFHSQVAELKASMRWQQMRSPSVVYPQLHGGLVCDIDRVRPAIPRQDLDKKKNQSDFSFERRTLGRREKKILLQKLLEGAVPQEFDVVSNLAELADDKVGRFGNLKDKIAVLRFDGNDFGKVIAGCHDAAALKDFSETTREQQRSFFEHLLLSTPGPEWWTTDDPPKLRLEVVVYGGDEVSFITPAWLGWKALAAFFRHLEESSLKRDRPLTYSAGLVFCHAKAPIHAIKRLASGLAEQAKQRAYDEFDKKDNFTVYQVLESFDAIGQDLEEFMKDRYAFSRPRGVFLGLNEIDALEKTMGLWRATLSRRRLHSLVRELVSGATPEPAQSIRELTESKTNSEQVQGTVQALHSALGDAAFLHILELWDYAGVEK